MEFCIKNVIEQNCSSIEHIIIDGGSTDKTVEIIRRYAKQHPHIRWISENDKGQSDAMNKGISMAKGKIVGFLNADDFYEPDILNLVIKLFEALPEPSLLVGNCNIWDDQGNIQEVRKPARLKITDLLLNGGKHLYPINSSEYFYHKSLHKVIGPYDIEEHYTLDIDFLCRAVQAAHVKYIDKILGNYRRIEGTKTVRDIQNGTCSPRYFGVLNRYRKRLPVMQRLEVGMRNGYIRFCDVCSRLFFKLMNKFLNHLRALIGEI